MSEKQSKKSTGRGGSREGAGRPKGVPNKMSATVKENVLAVFDRLGGIENMAMWAAENQTQFYNLYAKLLPTETKGTLQVEGGLVLIPGKGDWGG